MSASCEFVSINSMSQSPLWIWSLMKWCLIFIRFVLECMIGFLVILMTLVLSHLKGICYKCNPKSESYWLRHKICAQQLHTTMYSASSVNKATHAWFLLFHETRPLLNKWQILLVFFLSSVNLEKFESEYSSRKISTPLGYHQPTSKFPFRYFIILFIIEKWDSLGLDW